MLKTKACPHCDEGIVSAGGVEYLCTSCNGTGIQGSPRLGLLVVLLSAAFAVAAVNYIT